MPPIQRLKIEAAQPPTAEELEQGAEIERRERAVHDVMVSIKLQTTASRSLFSRSSKPVKSEIATYPLQGEPEYIKMHAWLEGYRKGIKRGMITLMTQVISDMSGEVVPVEPARREANTFAGSLRSWQGRATSDPSDQLRRIDEIADTLNLIKAPRPDTAQQHVGRTACGPIYKNPDN